MDRMSSRVEPFFDDWVTGFRSSLVVTDDNSGYTVVDKADADTADTTVAGVPAFSDVSSGSSTVTTVVDLSLIHI